MLVPALGQILQDFHIDSYKGQIAFSVFFLGLGWAPFIIAPLSEIYGRRPIWLIGNAFYILWNSLAPVGNSLKFMVVCRFLSACGASVGICVS
jgi:MFS family permease